MNIYVEIIGWIGSVLIVCAYFLNMRGTWKASSPYYILFNLFGGFFFIINTCWHAAYPSMVVNIIWVLIAGAALLKKDKQL